MLSDGSPLSRRRRCWNRRLTTDTTGALSCPPRAGGEDMSMETVITDEEIGMLREEALVVARANEAPQHFAAYAKAASLMYSADVALGRRRARRGDSKARARARCAAAWAARSSEPRR